jgi:hypothetical protein
MDKFLSVIAMFVTRLFIGWETTGNVGGGLQTAVGGLVNPGTARFDPVTGRPLPPAIPSTPAFDPVTGQPITPVVGTLPTIPEGAIAPGTTQRPTAAGYSSAAPRQTASAFSSSGSYVGNIPATASATASATAGPVLHDHVALPSGVTNLHIETSYEPVSENAQPTTPTSFPGMLLLQAEAANKMPRTPGGYEPVTQEYEYAGEDGTAINLVATLQRVA